MKKIIFLMLFITNTLFSQNVVLDTTFGTNGITLNPVSQTNESILGLEFQSDGKIICITSFNNQNNSNISLTKYSSEGILDTSFGSNGYVYTSLNSDFPINSFKVQNDDKIIVSGRNTENGNQISIVRYNFDGTIDTTFGNNGFSQGFSNFSDSTIDIQADLKIILAGSYSGFEGRDFGIIRLNNDGTLDETFGISGKVNYNLGIPTNNTFSDDVVYSVKALSDNKIIISGYTYLNEINGNDFAMIKLNTDGSLDTSFNNSGKLIDDYGGSEYFVCLTIDSENNIYVGGLSSFNSLTSVAFGKYSLDGVLVTNFGNQGKVITSSNTGNYMSISDIVVGQDGSIVCAGSDYNPNSLTSDMLLLKYTLNGNLDTTFDSDGIFIKDYNNLSDNLSALKIKSDGKILCGGNINLGTQSGTDSGLVQFSITNLSTSQYSKSQFYVSPNPFVNFINLNFSSIKSLELNIELFDINGRKIHNLLKNKQFTSGNNQLKIDLPESLANGLYYLIIKNGQNTTTLKVFK